MEPLIPSPATTNDEECNIEETMGESPLPTDSVDDNYDGILGDRWYQRILQVQRMSLLAAPCVASLAVMMVGVWITKLGGLSTRSGHAKLVFNWHPLLMILAFLFMTVASLSFRFSSQRFLMFSTTQSPMTRSIAKWGHGLCWAIAAGCMILGLMAVFYSHNDPLSGFIANLYSLHSWIGITMVILYLGQLLAGFGAFGIPEILGISPTLKFRLWQIHTFVGPILYHGVILTILLGIQEKEGFIGCAYKVDEADVRPWQHFYNIPSVCRISHGLGFLVVTAGVLTLIATHSFAPTDRRQR